MDGIVENRKPAHVDVGTDRSDVIVEQILFAHAAALARVALAERRRDRGVRLRQRGAAVPRLEFQAVVLRRIVARSHDDAAEELAVVRGEGDRLRRRRRVREDDAVAGRAQRLRDDSGELARQEAAVEADDECVAVDAGRRLEPARGDGDGVADAADVVEGEAVGDDRAPSVGPEGDH